MQPLAGSLLASMGGVVGHVRRHFRILSVESQLFGGGVKSMFFLGDENGFKKLDGTDFFPIH